MKPHHAQATEEQLHKAVARFLHLALPLNVFWTTIPAGGGGKARGGKLKAMGYRAGTPDIMFVVEGRAHFIELKTATGRMSDAQQDVHPEIARAKGVVALCRSLAEVEGTLIGWGIPLRTKAA